MREYRWRPASTGVEVTYVRGGQARAVRGEACVLACWNMVIPYMCPEMPEARRRGWRTEREGAAGVYERAAWESRGV